MGRKFNTIQIENCDKQLEEATKEFYSSLKEKQLNAKETLSSSELKYINRIEEIYSDKALNEQRQMEYLISQVRDIMDSKENWGAKHQQLLSMLVDITFIAMKDEKLGQYFNQLQDNAENIMKLDYLNPLPQIEINNEARNLFNYVLALLSNLSSSLRTSVVSVKSMNAILPFISDALILTTDEKGRIRFINGKLCKLLDSDPDEIIGQFAGDFFEDYKLLTDETKSIDYIFKPIQLKTSKGFIPLVLNLAGMAKDDTEVNENTYIMYERSYIKDKDKQLESKIDLEYDPGNQFACLTSIIAVSNTLNNQLEENDPDKATLAKIIRDHAWKLIHDRPYFANYREQWLEPNK